MKQFAIIGGHPVQGEVIVSGAKNAALGILAAATMTEQEVTVRNIPEISDTRAMIEAIQETGVRVKNPEEHTVKFNSKGICRQVVDNAYIRKIRAGYYLLGAFLGRFHYAKVALPGGCTIGSRPIDQHLKGFEALGATTDIEDGMIIVKADELTGGHIYFDTVSVGATINVMMAATLAKGRTILENVAKEPHIVDVANFLNSMGARIKGAGTDIIRIDGVTSLHGTDYAVIPDQIEAGTFMILAAITKGKILVRNVIPKHLECLSSKLTEMGCLVKEKDDMIYVQAKNRLKAARIRTSPYPGFPTDLQPQIAALLAISQGTSHVHETIFENRFKYTEELLKMGADITVNHNAATIKGVEKFKGAALEMPDLRAGAAITLAAIAAEGNSTITHIEFVERGYENFVEKLQGLGVPIRTVTSKAKANAFFRSTKE